MSALRTFLGVSVVIAIGCGGSTGSEVSGDGGSGHDATGGSSSGGSSGGTEDDSSVAGDDSGLPLVGPDGGLIVPPDTDAGGTAGDAGRPGGGVTTPPRGTDGGANQVACGATPCDSTSQVCCVARAAMGMGMTRSCTSAAACQGETLACTGTNSCPSGICCEEAAAGNTVTSKCEAMCPRGALQLCTTNADCTATNEICRRLGADISVCQAAPTFPMRDAGFGGRPGDGG